MRNKYFQVLILTLFLLFEACSSLTQRFKDEFDDSNWDQKQEEEKSNEGKYNEENDKPAGLSSFTNPSFNPIIKRQYQNGQRAKKEDFIDHLSEEGSLWASGGQTNYYFTKNFVRNPGEIIQISVEKELFQDVGTETKRTLGISEKEIEIQKIKNGIRSEVEKSTELAKITKEKEENKKDQIKLSAASPEKKLQTGENSQDLTQDGASKKGEESQKMALNSNSIEDYDLNKLLSKVNLGDVNIFQSLDMKEGEIMKGEILERFADGNYKVRAIKKIAYKNGPPRIVSVLGIIRGVDIGQEGDTIPSGKFYEYRVDVSH